MEIITAYLTASGVKTTLMAIAPIVAVYVLGLFRGSAPYRGLRSALGKFSENLGVQVSRLGNSKLKGLYEPIEDVFVDFWLFMGEQFAVGLRKDNPEKMLEHAERLYDVGSKTRLDGIINKMTEAAAEDNVISDPVIKRALELGRDLTKDRI